MGIKGLTKLLADNAPGCIRESEMKAQFGRKVAIDASMSLYQFLKAMSMAGDGAGAGAGAAAGLTDDTGATTSHLQGMFHRTIRLIANGVKPVYVFDGKPPAMKAGELGKRQAMKAAAEAAAEKAKESGDADAQARFATLGIRVTREQNEEAQKLLALMGVPVVQAPCEAEAQCAELAKEGLVYATGTEDMDALTLGTPVLLRHLTFSEARKMPIREIRLQTALQELNLTMDQFIDLCILLGCDYVECIPRIGPVSALKLIREHKNIETILKRLDRKKYPVPQEFEENFDAARGLFRQSEVKPAAECKEALVWNEPDEAGLIEFLCGSKAFSEDRVRSGIAKLRKARTTTVQARLTSFFGEPTVTVNRKRIVKEKQAQRAKAKAASMRRRQNSVGNKTGSSSLNRSRSGGSGSSAPSAAATGGGSSYNPAMGTSSSYIATSAAAEAAAAAAAEVSSAPSGAQGASASDVGGGSSAAEAAAPAAAPSPAAAFDPFASDMVPVPVKAEESAASSSSSSSSSSAAAAAAAAAAGDASASTGGGDAVAVKGEEGEAHRRPAAEDERPKKKGRVLGDDDDDDDC